MTATLDDERGPFEARLADAAGAVETTLDRLLGADPLDQEIARPARLIEAIRYATLGGGKRLRPFLLIEAAALFGVGGEGVLRAAAALEMLHGYSLVHDDLPAMDDDDLRRGRPTVHRAYDEATAILVGDALLTYAFDVMADPATHADGAVRADLVRRLARAAGLGGMVGGQMLDLAAEGRYAADGRPLALGADEIRRLQAMKTGALIRFACEAGAVIGGAGPADLARLGRYGAIIGLAFQIADDLIDLEATPEVAGKATGKDAERGKATLVALNGAPAMRAQLADLVTEAEAVLAPFGDRARTLVQTARFIAGRSF